MTRERLKREVYVIVMLSDHLHIARLVHILADVLFGAKTTLNLVKLRPDLFEQLLLLNGYDVLEIPDDGLCVGIIPRVCYYCQCFAI